jgi:hypothetical protein
MPTGRNKRVQFQTMEERYVKRMSDWRERTLSQVVNEVLIKAVAQALPTYVMSIFKVPLGLCEKLHKYTRSFWWGSGGGKNKVQWIPWELLIKPKSYGGLGFKDLKLFNQALLSHQAMRLIMHPNTMCTRVLKAKYYPQSNLLDTWLLLVMRQPRGA